MADKPNILIVDDSTADIHVMLECLKADFSIAVAKSGPQALAHCRESVHPKVILLDVSMPEMSGYEVCKHLKENEATANIDVIFVSANESLEEKLKGYDVGGSDYLTKPVQPQELISKVRTAVARAAQLESASLAQKETMDIAMTAMKGAGEQATIIHFLRDSGACESLVGLARLVVASASQYGLSSTAQIRTAWENIEASITEPIPPLEKEMLFALKDGARITQRGKRLVLNFGPISLLVKNMPLDDDDKCGRLRDHLALILEGAVLRIQVLMIQYDLNNLMRESDASLMRVRKLQVQQKRDGVQIMDDLMVEIHSTFLNFDLTDEQESVLIGIVEKYIEKSFVKYEEGLSIDEELQFIADQIHRASARMFS